MNREIFAKFVADAHAAWGKRQPDAKAMAYIWERLRDVPDEPTAWILEKIEAGERFPDNFVQTVKRLWSSWLGSHNKLAGGEQGKCPLGCDIGSFTAWKQERDGRWHQYGFDCPNCRPTGEHVADPRWLRQQGYRVQGKSESGCAVYAELVGFEYPSSGATNDWIARAKAARGKSREWDRDVNERTWRVEAQAGEGR